MQYMNVANDICNYSIDNISYCVLYVYLIQCSTEVDVQLAC